MSALTDYELTVLVEAAAEGATKSWAAHGRGLEWSQMGPIQKNAVRETALPFVYHGTKALAELGYSKPRTAGTVVELDALPERAVILDRRGLAWQKSMHGMWLLGPMVASSLDFLQAINNFEPATVLFEPAP